MRRPQPGNDGPNKVRWTQFCRLSCFIAFVLFDGGGHSPDAGYLFTVNDMINAQKSGGEECGALYLEQVAVHALERNDVQLCLWACSNTLRPRLTLCWNLTVDGTLFHQERESATRSAC